MRLRSSSRCRCSATCRALAISTAIAAWLAKLPAISTSVSVEAPGPDLPADEHDAQHAVGAPEREHHGRADLDAAPGAQRLARLRVERRDDLSASAADGALGEPGPLQRQQPADHQRVEIRAGGVPDHQRLVLEHRQSDAVRVGELVDAVRDVLQRLPQLPGEELLGDAGGGAHPVARVEGVAQQLRVRQRCSEERAGGVGQLLVGRGERLAVVAVADVEHAEHAVLRPERSGHEVPHRRVPGRHLRRRGGGSDVVEPDGPRAVDRGEQQATVGTRGQSLDRALRQPREADGPERLAVLEEGGAGVLRVEDVPGDVGDVAKGGAGRSLGTQKPRHDRHKSADPVVRRYFDHRYHPLHREARPKTSLPPR